MTIFLSRKKVFFKNFWIYLQMLTYEFRIKWADCKLCKTNLITLTFWQFYPARPLVANCPLP